MRFGEVENDGKPDYEKLIVVLNMGVQSFEKYRIGVQEAGMYTELINSDDTEYGGSGKVNSKPIKAEPIPMHGQPYSIEINMPVIGGTVFIHD